MRLIILHQLIKFYDTYETHLHATLFQGTPSSVTTATTFPGITTSELSYRLCDYIPWIKHLYNPKSWPHNSTLQSTDNEKKNVKYLYLYARFELISGPWRSSGINVKQTQTACLFPPSTSSVLSNKTVSAVVMISLDSRRYKTRNIMQGPSL